jgi:transcriptional regulator
MAGKFEPRSPGQIVELIATSPLAWIVPAGGGAAPWATPLPLRAITDAEGAVIALDGHFARSNPQVEVLRRHPRALILVMGVQGYISPSWMRDRTQAPTWTYASAQFLTEIAFLEGDDSVRASLDDLIGAMEAGRPGPWRAEEMGGRYAGLARRVIAFRARVVEARPVFKLGQDERDDVFADILAGLERDDRADLASWMREANPGRDQG